MDKIRAEAVYHDEERICFDDRIGVFIDPGHDHQNVFQFVVNAGGGGLWTAAGAAQSLRDEPHPWPARLEYRLVLLSAAWKTAGQARYRSPWTGCCDIRSAQRPIGFNACRDRGRSGRLIDHQQSITRKSAALAYRLNNSGSMAVDNWYEPIMFGDLVFDAGREMSKLTFYQSTADYNGNGWQRPQLWGDNPLDVTVRNRARRQYSPGGHL